MRKRLLAAALAILAAVGAVSAQESRLMFSCDTGRGNTGNFGGVGTPLKQDYDVAVKVDGTLFKGLTIEAIRVPMGEMENLSNLKVWLTKELALKTVDGKKQNVADITTEDAADAYETGGWVEVELENPYTLTGEDVYAGYSFDMDELDDTNQRPVKITTELHDGGLYVHTSRSYRNWTDVSSMCSSVMQVVFSGAPDNAASVSAEGAYFGATGKNTTVTFLLENHGAAGISSVDYTYEYAGQTHTGHTDLSPSVASVYNAASYFSFAVPAVDDKGYYPISLTITKVNGEDNTDTENSVTHDVSIFDAVPKRHSVLEEYTGTWCGYCPRGYVGLEVMNRLFPDDFIALSYHNDDPMEVMGDDSYPQTVSSFPAAYLDRRLNVDAYGGYDLSASSFGIDKAWLEACDEVSEASVSARAWLSDDKSSVVAKAEALFPLAVDKAKYAIELVLVADSLTGTTAKWMQENYYAKGAEGTFPEPEFAKFTGGDKYVSGLKFNDIVVATSRLLDGLYNLPESIEADKTYEAEAEIPFSRVVTTNLDPIVQNKKNLHVVALLINTSTGYVVNAAKTKVYEDEAAGIGTVELRKADTGAGAIYDISGRRTDTLRPGVNIVRAADGSTRKILVK